MHVPERPHLGTRYAALQDTIVMMIIIYENSQNNNGNSKDNWPFPPGDKEERSHRDTVVSSEAEGQDFALPQVKGTSCTITPFLTYNKNNTKNIDYF